MVGLADANEVGLVVKGTQAGLARGWTYVGANVFQSDRAAETVGVAALEASAAPGSELTYTLVPAGSEARIGIDRDEDGHLDRDELDLGSDPADAASVPGACAQPAPFAPADLAAVLATRTSVALEWTDLAASEDGYRVERAAADPGAPFTLVATLPADSVSFTDDGLPCDTRFRYRVQAFNCAGASGVACVPVRTRPCVYLEARPRVPLR